MVTFRKAKELLDMCEYVGGYDDWLRQRPEPAQPAPKAREAAAPRSNRTAPSTKLSYKDQRELDALPGRIEALETEQAELHQRLSDPDLYRQEGELAVRFREALGALEGELEAAYVRWEALEALRHRDPG